MRNAGSGALALPWQAQPWTQLRAALERERLGHALLLVGAPGTGRNRFAGALAQLLLCQQPISAGPCGACKSCLLVAEGAHADLARVAPEAPGKAIGIDAIRALLDFAGKTSALGARKAVVVSPLEAMTANAFNAFLKMLEEPPPGTYFLLVTAPGHRIPATVRSRCQQVVLPTPDAGAAADWLRSALAAEPDADTDDAEALLALAPGRPLTALAHAREGGAQELRAVAAALHDLEQGRGSVAGLLPGAARLALPELLDLLARRLQESARDAARDRRRPELRSWLVALKRIEELRALHLSGSNPNADLLRFAAVDAFASACEQPSSSAKLAAF